VIFNQVKEEATKEYIIWRMSLKEFLSISGK